MTYDEEDERGANLPPVARPTAAVYVLAGLAGLGVGTLVYGLYSLVALVF